jgi:histidine ammonia-lyase
VANVQNSLAIEILTACAGLDQRRPLTPSAGVTAAYRFIRRVVPEMQGDRPLYRDIHSVLEVVANGTLRSEVEKEVGALD